MVQYYQNKMYESLRAIYSYDEDKSLPVINKAEYKKLQKMQEAGMELTDEQKLAMAVYEVDYKVMNLVSDTTHNYGCGMGGNASFLDESKAIQMLDEAGRPLFTTLNGDQLRQRMDAEGNLLTDDEGNPVYENLDGSDYEGLAEVFAQRGYPVTDDDGNVDQELLEAMQDGSSISGEYAFVYELKAEKMIDKLQSTMLMKAKAMCDANGIEFDLTVFNTMFNNAKSSAVASSIETKDVAIGFQMFTEATINPQNLVKTFMTNFKDSYTAWVNAETK